MLLKKTKSLCPICKKILEAEIVEKNGKVYIDRTCPDHGFFSYLYWDDAEAWRRYEDFDIKGNGVSNPQVIRDNSTCPFDCGLCNNHKSTTLLANIDLTNRCNLNCDFCFANARACGYIYEPTFEQVKSMLELLRSEKPTPAPAVQFAGGEPTLREDLFEIIALAKSMGFMQVQLATNGILIAKDPEFALKLRQSGLSTVYLHFDGVSKETNFKLTHDLKAIENLRKAKQGIVLVPTIIKGKNDHELGDIVRFAAENIDVIRGVNFQPVSFTGAASLEDITRERITIPELLDRIESQTKREVEKEDFYPVPCVVPISDFVEAYTGKPQLRFTAHQHCGAATYVFVRDKKIVPINRMIDVDAFFESIDRLTSQLSSAGPISRKMVAINGIKELYSSIKKSEEGGKELWTSLGKALITHNFDSLREFHWNALFIGMMHFMDNYNYDIERVSRCCIHYATPDGTLIPFCSYNSGPVFREQVWKKYSQPLD
ncbi:radical SAM protein [Methanospirillum stamsii]|uniref:Radical SAM protein n=1 Tax=Methanospirillum stamsii TaxID=1277351 RepID=A0A2V2N9D3_9EURY|nr:radical SAM protein [Methanospirillum stamsii]